MKLMIVLQRRNVGTKNW